MFINLANADLNFSLNSSVIKFFITFIFIVNITQDTTPDYIWDDFGLQYQLENGNLSTLQEDISTQLVDIFRDTTLSGTSAYVFGSLSGTVYNDLIADGITGLTNVFSCNSMDLSSADLTSDDNDVWYYATFVNQANNGYSGYSFYTSISVLNSLGSGNFNGSLSGQMFTFSGTAFSEYNDVVVATLRSRGISLYNSTSAGPTYQVSGLTDVGINTAGSYSAITRNPFSTFAKAEYLYTDFDGNLGRHGGLVGFGLRF